MSREKWESVCQLVGVCTHVYLKHIQPLKTSSSATPRVAAACCAIALQRPLLVVASSDTSAAAARADQRLRAALAATVQPTIPTTNAGAVPPQGGPTRPTTPTTNVGAVPPQGGPTHPTIPTTNAGGVLPQGGQAYMGSAPPQGGRPNRPIERVLARRSRVHPFWRCITSMTRRRYTAHMYFLNMNSRRPLLGHS